jgi:putative membrane protein
MGNQVGHFPAMTAAQALLMLLASLLSGLRGERLLSAIVGTSLVAAVTGVANVLLRAVRFGDDNGLDDRSATRDLRRAYRDPPRAEAPGVLFLEIDGLAEPVLRHALARGRLPTLKRWLDADSHRITNWEPDLSSQTAASQAGILLGSNNNVPAFRWYDRALGRVLVSSRLSTAALLEQRLSRGIGLLVHDGASRCNMFSGDAADSLFTFSTIGRGLRALDGQAAPSDGYYLFFVNPYRLARTLVLYATDVVRELLEASWQRLRRVEPRIGRGGVYPLLRAFATTVGTELATYAVIRDADRGVPAVYATYYAYDEVAHHSGITSPDAMKVLARLDRALARIERAVERAPRRYHLVVLSDHGQSNGATFKQRYGESLADLVERLTPPQRRVVPVRHASEIWGHIDAALEEFITRGTRGARLVRSAVKGMTRDGHLCPGPDDDQPFVRDEEGGRDRTVVLASGNLGLVYFTAWPVRMTYEQITEACPALLPGLVRHVGIGFALVHSVRDGAMVVGRRGVQFLDQDRVEGEDPLAAFGSNAAAHLRRHDGFANAPDVLVNSLYRPETDEVAAFEELVGSHGGLGGPQTRPFVLHPVTLDPGAEPIVGAAALHAVLAGWLAQSEEGSLAPWADPWQRIPA